MSFIKQPVVSAIEFTDYKNMNEIVIMADTITLKTRYYNGVLQYRHYNETKKRWVETDWINY
jgi:hypothetical protein